MIIGLPTLEELKKGIKRPIQIKKKEIKNKKKIDRNKLIKILKKGEIMPKKKTNRASDAIAEFEETIDEDDSDNIEDKEYIRKIIRQEATKVYRKELRENKETLQRATNQSGGYELAEAMKTIFNAPTTTPNNGGKNSGNDQLSLNQAMQLVTFMQKMNPQQKQNTNNDNNTNMSAMMTMFMKVIDTIVAKSDQNVAYMLQRSAPPNESPEERFVRTANFLRDWQGDQRAKSDKEMEFGLKERELDIQQQQTVDMLDREERAILREDRKTQNIIDITKEFIQPILKDGLGGVISDVMSARKDGKDKRRGRSEPEELFDRSILSSLNDED